MFSALSIRLTLASVANSGRVTAPADIDPRSRTVNATMLVLARINSGYNIGLQARSLNCRTTREEFPLIWFAYPGALPGATMMSPLRDGVDLVLRAGGWLCELAFHVFVS